MGIPGTESFAVKNRINAGSVDRVPQNSLYLTVEDNMRFLAYLHRRNPQAREPLRLQKEACGKFERWDEGMLTCLVVHDQDVLVLDESALKELRRAVDDG